MGIGHRALLAFALTFNVFKVSHSWSDLLREIIFGTILSHLGGLDFSGHQDDGAENDEGKLEDL
jgi:hypothetical protein